MAYEIISNQPLRPIKEPKPVAQAETREQMLANAREAVSDLKPEESDSVAYNPQHDAKSIYWVSLWNATSRVEHEPSWLYARWIFRNIIAVSHARRKALFLDVQTPLLQVFAPEIESSRFACFLETYRAALCNGYVHEGKYHNANVTAREEYGQIHIDVEYAFNILLCGSDIEWREVVLLQDERVKPAATAQDDTAPDPGAQCRSTTGSAL